MHVDFRHVWGILLSVLFTIVLEAAGVLAAQDAKVLHVGNFSRGEPGGRLPEGWKPLTFKKIESHTDYRLVADQGHTVVKAHSNSSSSGLAREIKVDPKEYPIVQWSWKVEHLPQQGDVTEKSGDDYAARLYVTFEYDPSLVGLLDKAKISSPQDDLWPVSAVRRDQLHLGKQNPPGHHRPESLHQPGQDDRAGDRDGSTERVGGGRTQHLRRLQARLRGPGAAHDQRGGDHDRYGQHRRTGDRLLRRHFLPQSTATRAEVLAWREAVVSPL